MTEAEAFLRVVDDAERLLQMLQDGVRRGGSAAELSKGQLEILLAALAARCQGLGGQAEIEEERRQRYQRFAAAVAGYQAQFVPVSRHLIEMSRDWRCAFCGVRVAAGARLSGDPSGAFAIDLLCRQCGQATPLTEKGQGVFQQRFGALVAPGWNPELNGFQWVRR